MTSHPCDGHLCDHCYICDVVGICCATLSAEQRAQLEAAANNSSDERLREAVKQERGTQPSIAQLVRGEAASRSQTLPAPILDDSRKEPVYAVPTRTTR
jgi:hypothetical protein